MEKDTILPNMWKMQKNAVIRDEMKNGEEYVDQYVNARKDLKGKIRSNTIQPDTPPDIIILYR